MNIVKDQTTVNFQDSRIFSIDNSGKLLHAKAVKELNSLNKLTSKIFAIFNSLQWLELETTLTCGKKQIVYVNINSLAKRFNLKKEEVIAQYKNGNLQQLLNNRLSTKLEEKDEKLDLKTAEQILSLDASLKEKKDEIIQTVRFLQKNKKEILELSKLCRNESLFIRKSFFNQIPLTLQILNKGSVCVNLNKFLGRGGVKKVKQSILITQKNVKLVAVAKTIISIKAPLSNKWFSHFDKNEACQEVKWRLLLKNKKNIDTSYYHHSSYIKENVKKNSFEKFQVITDFYPNGDFNNLTKANLSLQKKFEVALSLLQGLKVIHEKNLIHFDIKPENILLDKNLNPYIIDFGSIEKEENVSSLKYHPATTPMFQAPEFVNQWKNIKDKIKKSYDVWSMGIVLYALFKNIDTAELLDNEGSIKDKELQTYLAGEALEPENRNSIEHLIWEMLQVDPNKRISTKNALKKIERIINNH